MSTTFKKVIVREKTTDPHKATEVVSAPVPTSVAADEILVKVAYVGINATDMNTFMGVYFSGDIPFDCGLEALGTVVLAGADSPHPVGTNVMFLGLGAFAEYRVVKAATVIPVPAIEPKYLTVPISLLTAAIAVGEQAHAKPGEVALVTAAAGGTGQFAVQVLKAKGCTVVGTCSNAEKAAFLKKLGCDRVINYKTENLCEVLKAEFPKGLDIVYESVGGDTFEACYENLAVLGRMIVIGSITGYKDQTAFRRPENAKPLQADLLFKSATLSGFFLSCYANKFPQYLAEYMPQVASGAITCHVDVSKEFVGIEQVADAIAHLHAGASFGKVVVKLQ